MKKYFFYIIIFLCFSCEKVIDIDTDYSNERIIIDATVFKKLNEKFATATVKVSTTAPFFSENNTEINNAEVFIKTQKGIDKVLHFWIFLEIPVFALSIVPFFNAPFEIFLYSIIFYF